MEETISLKEIFEVIKKRFSLILFFIIVSALIAAIVSYFILTPTYESTSQFIVNQEREDPSAEFSTSDIRTNVELINTYEVIIKSRAILEDVVEEMNLPYSVGTLADNIEVTSEEDSQVVNVTVSDPDPVLATDIANVTVSIFQEQVPDLMSVDNVNILSEAQLAANPEPVSPKPALNIAIAIVLGGMIGIGLAFLLEYLDTTITTEEDLEQHLDIPVLGTIAHIEDQDIMSSFKVTQSRRGGYGGSTQKKTS